MVAIGLQCGHKLISRWIRIIVHPKLSYHTEPDWRGCIIWFYDTASFLCSHFRRNTQGFIPSDKIFMKIGLPHINDEQQNHANASTPRRKPDGANCSGAISQLDVVSGRSSCNSWLWFMLRNGELRYLFSAYQLSKVRCQKKCAGLWCFDKWWTGQ